MNFFILLIRWNCRDFLLSSVKKFNISPECYLHVSIVFFPHMLSKFKYSLHALSTIAYKHLEITESLWADRKREQCSEVIKCGLEPTVFVDGLCIHQWSGGGNTQGINYLCIFFFLFLPNSWKWWVTNSNRIRWLMCWKRGNQFNWVTLESNTHCQNRFLAER